VYKHIFNTFNAFLQRSFNVHHEEYGGSVNLMAHSGIGLWISLKGSPTICLYHTETFKHLQDINVASNVARILGADGNRDQDRDVSLNQSIID
jgi:Rho guanine nucleotide exchange factor 10